MRALTGEEYLREAFSLWFKEMQKKGQGKPQYNQRDRDKGLNLKINSQQLLICFSGTGRETKRQQLAGRVTGLMKSSGTSGCPYMRSEAKKNDEEKSKLSEQEKKRKVREGYWHETYGP